MNRLLLCFCIVFLIYGCSKNPEPINNEASIKSYPDTSQDKDRIEAYNKLDDLKEGIWRVDEWIKYANDICTKSKGKDCAVMADVYYNDFYGYGNKKDIEKSITMLQKGCDLLDSQSCLDLAIITDKSSTKNNNAKEIFIKAYDLAKQQCDNDYAMECFVLSQIHFVGYNVFSRDRGAAKDLADKSCHMGYARACIFLGINADTRDDAKAAYKRACDLGVKEFCK